MGQNPRTPLRLLLLTVLLAAAGYVAFCAMVAANKEDVLYPSHGRERAAGRTPPGGVEAWWRELPNGTGRVEAWWKPAPGASPAHPAPAVMYFHGNAELIDDNLPVAKLWNQLGVSVLLCEHVGYGRSAGAPSLENDIANAAAWFDVLADRPEVRGEAILAHGFSLGGAFAAQLAERRPVAGVVLESTFSSLPSMARRMRVWLYFGGERLDTAAVLRGLDPAVPVLITHGRLDRVIPVEEGRRLAQARPGARYFEDDFPHTPWAQDDPDQALLKAFLAQALARTDRP
jgi:alpha-beta hydrolase superfamily lysophospholipase